MNLLHVRFSLSSKKGRPFLVKEGDRRNKWCLLLLLHLLDSVLHLLLSLKCLPSGCRWSGLSFKETLNPLFRDCIEMYTTSFRLLLLRMKGWVLNHVSRRSTPYSCTQCRCKDDNGATSSNEILVLSIWSQLKWHAFVFPKRWSGYAHNFWREENLRNLKSAFLPIIREHKVDDDTCSRVRTRGFILGGMKLCNFPSFVHYAFPISHFQFVCWLFVTQGQRICRRRLLREVKKEV